MNQCSVFAKPLQHSMKNAKLFDFIYIAATVLLTVYGQLVLKWRMELKGAMPERLRDKVLFMARAYTDPWILSGFGVAFLASVAWSITLTKFELSFAYPFTSLSFIVVFFLSIFLFREPFSVYRLLGIVLIMSGLVMLARK